MRDKTMLFKYNHKKSEFKYHKIPYLNWDEAGNSTWERVFRENSTCNDKQKIQNTNKNTNINAIKNC